MNIRAFQLPQDIDIMDALIREGFQYPENPAWSVQDDEIEGMIDNLNGAKRMWPLLRVTQLFLPLLRDILCGFIAEDENQPVGIINYMRQRNAPEWHIGNVTVLPSHRRRGIARQLVAVTLAELKSRRASKAFLEVLVGNDPAFHLYKALGFEDFTHSAQYHYQGVRPITPIPLPQGYTLEPLSRFDWRPRFEFAKRVTPESIARYEAVVESRFRIPFFASWMGKLFETTSGFRRERFAMYSPQGDVVGVGRCSYRTRTGGVNDIDVHIDPAHSCLAEFLLRHALVTVQKASPGRRIEFMLDDWESDLLQAAEAIGCEKRFGVHRMGMEL